MIFKPIDQALAALDYWLPRLAVPDQLKLQAIADYSKRSAVIDGVGLTGVWPLIDEPEDEPLPQIAGAARAVSLYHRHGIRDVPADRRVARRSGVDPAAQCGSHRRPSMIAMQHIQRAHDFMAALQTTCADRRLPMPDIREVIVTERRQRVFAFAVFPQAVGHKQEAYADDRFLHQLSSTLHGLPVAVSNHTGFRLAALLDGPRELLPKRLAYPEHLPGQVRLGLDAAGREVSLTWEQFGHGLIVGMTGAGKSSMLRVLAAEALADGHALIIGDLHDNTFPMLAGHAALLAPIAHTVVDYIERLKLIKAIADERRVKYVALHARGVYPDNLEEYNAAVEPAQRLSRVVAFFDEISTACDQDRGRYGELAHLAFQAATEVRKFGINLIFSGQSITADLIGPMRDQLSTRVCFRVARKEISRIAVFRSGAELIDQAGRALTPNGLWQAYYLDKQRLIKLAQVQPNSVDR